MLFDPIEIMPLPPNKLDQERWEKACIDELAKHGGSQKDLQQLIDQLRKFRESNNQPQHSHFEIPSDPTPRAKT